MRIVFIGCVQFSYQVLQNLLESPSNAKIVGIVTRQQSKFNSDFVSLEPLATQAECPYFIAEGNNQTAMIPWLKKTRPDVIYCFGWSYLLKNEILGIPPLGVIGYHPTVLPKNRGRHPIIWTLALGLKETGSTFFFMDENADSGHILSQKIIPVEDSDNAATLYEKLTKEAFQQIQKFTPLLASKRYARTPQDHTLANYWRKRTKYDGAIDWRMSAKSINDLVRALTLPYVGAHCLYQGNEIKIWKTALVQAEIFTIDTEPGKVIDSTESNFTIKCGEGLIKILQHEFVSTPTVGEYL